MSRFILTVAVLAVCAFEANAGPIRAAACAAREAVQNAADRVRERVEARPHVRQLRNDVKAVADSRPVARLASSLATVLACPGGVCPK